MRSNRSAYCAGVRPATCVGPWAVASAGGIGGRDRRGAVRRRRTVDRGGGGFFSRGRFRIRGGGIGERHGSGCGQGLDAQRRGCIGAPRRRGAGGQAEQGDGQENARDTCYSCRRQVRTLVLLFPRRGTGPKAGNLTVNFTVLPAFLSCQFAVRASRIVTPLSAPGGNRRWDGPCWQRNLSCSARRSRMFLAGNCCRSARGESGASCSPAAARAARA